MIRDSLVRVFHFLHSLRVSFQLPEAQCHLGLALHRHFLTEPTQGQAVALPLTCYITSGKPASFSTGKGGY